MSPAPKAPLHQGVGAELAAQLVWILGAALVDGVQADHGREPNDVVPG